MKTIILFFFINTALFSGMAQSIEGIYYNKWESSTGEALAYTLQLNEDGTFQFLSARSYLGGENEKTTHVFGTWQLEGHLLILSADKNLNQDSKLAVWIDNNRARYISLSPRNPNFNLVKPSLKFYESKVFYAKDMELIKTETNITSRD